MIFKDIHTDSRGNISILTGEELAPAPEVTIFTTKAGMARGGCIHRDSSEHICVLAGRIAFIIKGGELTHKIILNTGDSTTIPANIPHYFVSITDSVVMEWGPQISEKNERSLEFRKIVDEINESKSNDSSI